jgi:hypothetical protein
MPLQKLQFRPGVNREGTDYSNEGGWYACDKVRFRSGFPEKIGGWIRLSNDTFLGIARALWNWVALNGANYLGVGTNLKYYIEQGGGYNDITPIRVTFTANTSPNTVNCIATSNGSNVVTLTIASYGGLTNDFVTISGANAIGSITSSDLNREHQITYVDTTKFSFVVANTANTTVTAGGGNTINVAFQIQTGLDVFVVGTGWGAGTWPTYIQTSLTNPFTCTSPSTTVTVTQTAHGLSNGNAVYFNSISGNVCGIASTPFVKAFSITVVNANAYTFSTVIGSNTYTTSNNGPTGGTVVVSTPVAPFRGWGTAADVGIGQQLRLWTNDNFGEDLLIAPRGGQFITGMQPQVLVYGHCYLTPPQLTQVLQGSLYLIRLTRLLARLSNVLRLLLALTRMTHLTLILHLTRSWFAGLTKKIRLTGFLLLQTSQGSTA